MTIFDAIVLGVLQGLTEFLPISSSGHLVLGQHFLGIAIPGNAFEVVVHLGTLFSVLVVLRKDIWQLLRTIGERSSQRYILAILMGTLPAAFIGIIFKDWILQVFEHIQLVSLALFVTGLILIATHWMRCRDRPLTIPAGILIGLAQAIAIIPGISRSGITIGMGLFLGMRSDRAARFSFLLSIPAIAGAGLLTFADTSATGGMQLSLPVIVTGLLTSFFVGVASLYWLLGWLKSGKFHWFGVYCLLMGLITGFG